MLAGDCHSYRVWQVPSSALPRKPRHLSVRETKLPKCEPPSSHGTPHQGKGSLLASPGAAWTLPDFFPNANAHLRAYKRSFNEILEEEAAESHKARKHPIMSFQEHLPNDPRESSAVHQPAPALSRDPGDLCKHTSLHISSSGCCL